MAFLGAGLGGVREALVAAWEDEERGGAMGVAEHVIKFFALPDSLAALAASCVGFFSMMVALCAVLEARNPARRACSPEELRKRNAQIWNEVRDCVPAVVCSTSFSLGWLKFVYRARWGVEAHVFPASPAEFLLEGVVWIVSFEASSYYLHRILHMRSPINFWQFHQPHHLYRSPTSFCGQAIDIGEAIMFAQCAVLMTLVWPISLATQLSWGFFMLIWSIFAHDSQGFLDGTFHQIHHDNFKANFGGVLGLFDVLHGTVFWSAGAPLPYEPKMSRWEGLLQAVTLGLFRPHQAKTK